MDNIQTERKQRSWLKKLLGALGIAALFIIAVTAWSFFKPTQAASGPIEAVALSSSTKPTATENTAGAATVYTISSEGSEARFLIDEVLRGEDVTVVGTTDQVAAELSVDLADASEAQLGTILVNVRDLATDSEFRDRAIKNQILLTDEYEYVSFTPTDISGLPDTVNVGDSFDVQVTGDLTITDTTLPTTFTATVTAVSEDELMGTATTTFDYADFGLEIPFSQSVDAVEDSVTLELDFTARTQS